MNENINFIKNPALWPKWPMLPVKRSRAGSWPEMRTILAAVDPKIVLYDFNIFDPPVKDNFLDMKAIEAKAKETYESAEVMVADGWIVD